jgi:hypothetical protein
MNQRVTYGQLRDVLTGLGFHETCRDEGAAFKHQSSDTTLLFRPHADSDALSSGEVFVVQHMLDEKGLLEPESFEVLLARTPA